MGQAESTASGSTATTTNYKPLGMTTSRTAAIIRSSRRSVSVSPSAARRSENVDSEAVKSLNRQGSLLSSLSEKCSRTRRGSLSSWPAWYHGWIKKSRVDELLAGHMDGLFLVKNSTDFPGDLTLCVSHGGAVMHHRIKKKGNRFTIDNDTYFAQVRTGI